MKALIKETIIAIRKKASKFLSKIVNSFTFINLTVVAIICLFLYCLSPMRLAKLLFAVFSVFMFDVRLYCVVVIFASLALFFYVKKQEHKIPVGAFTIDCELGTVYLHHEGKYIHVDDIIKISGTPHYYGGRIGADHDPSGEGVCRKGVPQAAGTRLRSPADEALCSGRRWLPAEKLLPH